MRAECLKRGVCTARSRNVLRAPIGRGPTETEVRMKVLIGVDPHKASVTVAVVDEALRELLERASKSLRAAFTLPRSLPSVRHLPANQGLRRRSRTALRSLVARRRTVRSTRRSPLRRSDQGSPGVIGPRALFLRLG